MSFPILPIAEISAYHLIGLAFIGLLVFGKRLPEIGRSLGKSVTEFKKGLNGIEDTSPQQQQQLPPQQQQQQQFVQQQPQASQGHVTAQLGTGTQQPTNPTQG